MGACPCMSTKSKEVVNKKGIINTRGGTVLGGGEGVDDVAAARAAKFEAKRNADNNRGLTKESAIEMQIKKKKFEEADKIEQERKGSEKTMKW